MGFKDPTSIVNVKRVLVDTTPRTLETLGVTVDPATKNVSLLNVDGSTHIYYDYDQDPDTADPTVGSPTSPFIPASYGSVQFDLVEPDVKKLRFVVASGTAQLLVQQEGDED
jgi:hypothetical protein